MVRPRIETIIKPYYIRSVRLPVVVALLLALLVAAPAHGADRVIVALGDSLTAGLGVARDEAYPALLEARLRREKLGYHVVNAGVSGDTSAGGRRRVDWVLRTKPEVVFVALGANDGLRGLPVDELRDNLEAIVRRVQGAGARVLLAGMRVPPNYGDEYARAFAAVFPEVARRTGAALAPFLLEGVAGHTRLNQADGIHPTAEGQRIIAAGLWPHLRPLLHP
jgi:acyl-CoA thioesterase-1